MLAYSVPDRRCKVGRTPSPHTTGTVSAGRGDSTFRTLWDLVLSRGSIGKCVAGLEPGGVAIVVIHQTGKGELPHFEQQARGIFERQVPGEAARPGKRLLHVDIEALKGPIDFDFPV
jgi:hypothetical protein